MKRRQFLAAIAAAAIAPRPARRVIGTTLHVRRPTRYKVQEPPAFEPAETEAFMLRYIEAAAVAAFNATDAKVAGLGYAKSVGLL
jgi:hypothetical protein